MTFAHPTALFGLALLPIIAAFYLWRAQHRRQVVSSTWLWSEVLARFSHQPSRRLPLQEPLLLLQLLAALVLTLLLAGPALSHNTRLHRIVILDNSLTMAATDLAPSRWQVAERRVQTLIGGIGADESVSLILAGPRATVIGSAPSGIDLARLITTLPRPMGTADLAGAAALARGLANGDPPGTVVLQQFLSAQTSPVSLPGLPSQIEYIGGALDDQAITVLTTSCLPSGACQAFARVRSSANRQIADTLAVWADGKLLGRQPIQIPANGSLDLDFAVPPTAHLLRAALLRHDSLESDNTAWALTPLPEPRSALLVSDSPGQLVLALRAVPGLNVQVIGLASYQDSLAVGKDLLIMDGVLPDILPPIATLIVNPPADSSVLQVQKPSVFLPITQVIAQDPIVAGLDLYHVTLTGEAIAVPAWARQVAGGANGPVILSGVLDGQRTAVVPWDAAHGDVAQDPVFPLLIEHLVRWLAPPVPPTLPLSATLVLPPAVLSARSPSGMVLQGPIISAAEPGLYLVGDATGARTPGDPLFVVPAAGEPAPEPSTAPAAWMLLGTSGTQPQLLWPLAVALALLALSAEWWFYARRT